MNTFRRIMSLLMLLLVMSGSMAQSAKDIGLISLNPFIPDNEKLGTQSVAILKSKLQQIVTYSGMSGAGFDNRFIITPNVQILDESQTQTMPQKTAVRISLGIYIGDGIDGTLYSNYTCELKGIGDSRDQAVASAIRKLRPQTVELQDAILIGKKKILNYYDRMSPKIISNAKAAASSGEYDSAVSMLFAIPMTNSNYATAQQLISQYGQTALENKNLSIVRDARAKWSADPTEAGASEAMAMLDSLSSPSVKVQAEAKALSNEIAGRLKAVSDREFKLEQSKIQNEKEVQMETVRAAASVATAYYANQPKVVYHYYWW